MKNLNNKYVSGTLILMVIILITLISIPKSKFIPKESKKQFSIEILCYSSIADTDCSSGKRWFFIDENGFEVFVFDPEWKVSEKNTIENYYLTIYEFELEEAIVWDLISGN